METLPTTADYLNELANQKSLLAAKLAAEGTGATNNDTFNTLVEQAQELHGTDKKYSPTSEKAQSGIAVAEGIDDSVGEINSALASLVEPSEIDPESWMNETVDAAVEEIKAENKVTIATKIEEAVTNLSTENEASIKKQVAEAVDNLEASVRRSFIANAKRVTNGNVVFEENSIYVIVKAPAENSLIVFNPDTLEPVTISDRHYCIIVGNTGDDVADSVCATVISYPSLDPQLYVVKSSTLQGAMTWNGTAIMSVVKNALVV